MRSWSRASCARQRRIYKIWVEGKPPDVVIETTSRKTRRKDTQDKPPLYARLGVKEYFLYDPLQEYLDPPLQGYRLGDQEAYAPIPPDETQSLISEQLGLRLRIEQGLLQFYRLDTGERLLTAEERACAKRRPDSERSPTARSRSPAGGGGRVGSAPRRTRDRSQS